MSQVSNLHNLIIGDLEVAGLSSPYAADANEPDPRYKSYGVRAPAKKKIFATHRPVIRTLSLHQQTDMITKRARPIFWDSSSRKSPLLEHRRKCGTHPY